MTKKLIVEKIEERFIKMWQEFHEGFKKEGCEKLIISAQELIKLEGEKCKIFWHDLRKKYRLENAEHLQINSKTWQIFEIFENEKREVQVVGRISEDLIGRWQEIEKIRKEIDKISPKAAASMLLYESEKGIFWDKLEEYYHLQGKSLSLDPKTWSIYEYIEPPEEKDLVTQINFRNAFNILGNLSNPLGIAKKDNSVN